jgi:hypothetical protein
VGVTTIETPSNTDPSPGLGYLVVPLLKGVVYRDSDEPRWQQLTRMQMQVRDYVGVLGLELYLDDAEGYAFLRTPPSPDTGTGTGTDTDTELPRLVSRRRLTYGVSLLLALLRKRLAEFDATSGETKLVMSRSQIVELVSVYQPPTTNEAKQVERVERDINNIADLGFLRPMHNRTRRNEEPTYEVRRILKAFIDAQWMSEFDARLDEYRRNGATEPDGNTQQEPDDE